MGEGIMIKYADLGLVNTKKMFADARKFARGIGGYNFNNLEQLQAIIFACAKTNSPALLQVSKGARDYIGVPLLASMAKGAVDYAKSLGAKIPVALHLDHGDSFELCKSAIDSGFSSVMIDASGLPFDENVKITKKVVAYAKKFNVSVEAEIGVLGGIEEDVKHKNTIYTNPDDAIRFVKLTGIDSLAIAIGTKHGAYKFDEKNPKLRIDILKKVVAGLPKNFPIVLHGASSVDEKYVKDINKFGGKIKGAFGVPESEIKKAIKAGVVKVNIDSDSRLAFTAGVRKGLVKNPELFDPRSYLKLARENMIQLYSDKNKKVFGWK